MVSLAILARGSEAVKASKDRSLITIKSATIFSDSGFCQRDKRTAGHLYSAWVERPVPGRAMWAGIRIEVSMSDTSGGARGPLISAIPFRESSDGKFLQLLSDRERRELAQIASLVRFRRGEAIYREGARADSIFNIAVGVAKTFRTLPDGTRRIGAFLFPDDLLGLAEEGIYVNSAEAVTPITAYRLPLGALANLLRSDAMLEFHILCKLCHELREAQRHAFILGRHRALSKIAMFVLMLSRSEQARERAGGEIYLPMTRTDIADYTGMSLGAVSRSFRAIEQRGLIRFRDRRHLQITDRAGLQSLIDESRAGRASAGDRDA